ncbi:MAG: GDYXXLXY domain-containing protein [Pseudomonadota bacterium]
MRKLIVAAGAVLILAVVNFSIWQKENLLADGRIVLLELAPVDPRSLMQGDYMALRYKLVNEVFGREDRKNLSDGHVIVTLDEKGVGTFKRFDDGAALAPNDVRMRYRIRSGQVKFATNAFFFQEGLGPNYQGARFGEFRVSEKGELLLTALRGGTLELLGPQKKM